MSVTAGARLADRYVLLHPIGTGGMGTVWRAADEVLDRHVAVKVLAGQLTDDPEFRVRLRREARAAARLDHPSITQVYDYGEVTENAHTVQYLVMELLSGQILADRLEAGPLSVPEALSIGAEVAEALAAAHRRGVIHRDVTPGNIMLTAAAHPGGTSPLEPPAMPPGGTIPLGPPAISVKVLDFGISTLAGDAAMTVAGRTLGTPAYLAPERVTGTPATPAVDVYALATVLVHAVTGHPVHEGSWSEQAYAHVHATPVLDDLPPGLRQLLARCLAKDPVQRPSAGELAQSLRGLSPGASAGPGVLPPSAVPRPSQPRRGAPGRVVSAARPAETGDPGTRVLPTGAFQAAGPRVRSRTALGRLNKVTGVVAVALLALGGGLLVADLLRSNGNPQAQRSPAATSTPPTSVPSPSATPTEPASPEAAVNDLRDIVTSALVTGDISRRTATDIGRTLTAVVGLVERGRYESARERLDDLAERLQKRDEHGDVTTRVYRDVTSLIDYLHDAIPPEGPGDD